MPPWAAPKPMTEQVIVSASEIGIPEVEAMSKIVPHISSMRVAFKGSMGVISLPTV